MAPPDPDERTRNFVQALYDFTDPAPTTLDFKAGDIIEIIAKQPSGWWDGMIYGTPNGAWLRGWFPSNYVGQIIRGGDEENINGDQQQQRETSTQG